jgi:hypothetical protein
MFTCDNAQLLCFHTKTDRKTCQISVYDFMEHKDANYGGMLIERERKRL